MKVGRRLAMKVLNASKFVLGSVGATALDPPRSPSRSTGRCSPGWPTSSTGPPTAFDAYDYTTALEVDREVLLGVLRRLPRAGQGAGVRRRTAAPATASARATLAIALHVQLRLLAPFLPYVTEEVWSWWQEGSIHRHRGRARPSWAAPRRPTRRCSTPSRRPWSASAARSRRPRCRCAPSCPRVEITGPRGASWPPSRRPTTCARRQVTGDLVLHRGRRCGRDQRRRRR